METVKVKCILCEKYHEFAFMENGVIKWQEFCNCKVMPVYIIGQKKPQLIRSGQ